MAESSHKEKSSAAPSYRPVAWMAKNPVAANLLMLILIVGGSLILFTQVKQEVFPDFEIDRVSVTVPYPGASPEEVEKGILLAIEEAVRGIDGVKEVRSTASEGAGTVNVVLYQDADKNKTSAEIKNEIDRITSFPEDAEDPIVKIPTTRRQVLSLILYGNVSEKALRELAETIRDDLLKSDDISQVELTGTRPPEISLEVPQAVLRAHQITLDQVAAQVRQGAVELPGGGVDTPAGEVLLRTDERRDWGEEFADLAIVSNRDGSQLRLGDIARIQDGFEDLDQANYFNGQPAIQVEVFRIGDQTPTQVAAAVKAYRSDLREKLPPGVRSAIWLDRSEIFYDRVTLLRRNALIGLVLVLGILGLFLEVRLAFWVTVGIPISFLGSFLFLPAVEVSINMISLFAFIVTLGMVVDDAIVVGESVYVKRKQGFEPIPAAIAGAGEVAVPVTFSIFTSVAAFAPMLFVEGTMGKVFKILPSVVSVVLLISLFESLFILPAHLGHLGPEQNGGLIGALYRVQRGFGRRVEHFARHGYGRAVGWVVEYRWITWALAMFMLIVSLGFVAGGRLNIIPFPKIQSDWVVAEATLPFGVSMRETRKVRARLEQAARAVIDSETQAGKTGLSRGIYTRINGSHSIRTVVFLVPSDQRAINATEFAGKWRKQVGGISGLDSLVFDSTAGGPRGGSPVDVQLSHRHMDTLEAAAAELAEELRAYAGVTDIDDGFSRGKFQLNFKIRPEAESLGLTALAIGRQMRHHFYGVEALRQQRGRDTLRVMVRLPESERVSEYDIETLLIRTPDGGELPLFRAARATRGTSYTSISRTDGRRTVHVTADVEEKTANAGKILAALVKTELPALLKKYPGLSYTFAGANEERQESMRSLGQGFAIALLVMYVLIAIPFNSYLQPLIILSAIPFGFIGAVIGHLLMGFSMSLISMMGLVALSGVVVNDSLVLLHTANRLRRETSVQEAVARAGIQRFRPIILTSMTTFLGLTPMIFETSLQARFLIPMAISLGFGVLFATVIILLMVPAFYVILEDIKGIVKEMGQDLSRLLGRSKREPVK